MLKKDAYFKKTTSTEVEENIYLFQLSILGVCGRSYKIYLISSAVRCKSVAPTVLPPKVGFDKAARFPGNPIRLGGTFTDIHLQSIPLNAVKTLEILTSVACGQVLYDTEVVDDFYILEFD